MKLMSNEIQQLSGGLLKWVCFVLIGYCRSMCGFKLPKALFTNNLRDSLYVKDAIDTIIHMQVSSFCDALRHDVVMLRGIYLLSWQQ